ncbi:DUF4082 domain-containing protein [Lentzea sp. NPDC005914]|uniref:DUF4082 domain-containing protein n=1 Tax=Lentzea sp. NPDC005914 TaxID=3154572 RepID=UPI0033CFB096
MAATLVPAVVFGPVASAAPCDAPVTNPVLCENSKTGDTSWDATGGGDPSIEGFATQMSVNLGQTIKFKVKTSAPYRIDLLRLGYYGGAGARKVDSITPTPRNQPANCGGDANTGLVDCGNWLESASWTVPTNLVSGVYVANLQRLDQDINNHIVFVVRDDARSSKMVFQTSDTTWQAYNTWGGKSFYGSRAQKLSYNRPFSTRTDVPDGRDFIFGSEYPMIRFMERNGYDVSYISGIDSDRSASLLLNHKIFLSVGHDEYWSSQQRANVEAARDAGVNLAFFSGNEVFWKTRWENSVDGTNTPYRTLVTYKETHDNMKSDPNAAWTGTWRDPRFSPPADGGRPENSLTGQLWTVNCCSYAIQVPADDGKMRFWRNTSVANQSAGQVATLAPNTLGYEWDEDVDNGFRPKNMIRLSKTTQTVDAKIQDYGTNVAQGDATHRMTLYKAASGALVFGAGTVQWSWGLDSQHDGAEVATDQRIQQATVNLFGDMGVQPGSLEAGLIPGGVSTDGTAPNTVITSPAAGGTVHSGDTITVTGTASDTGGRVGGVEVSLDGGTTWHVADGRESWSYTGSIPRTGALTIQARATDDSLNTDASPASVGVNSNCPCTIFPDLSTPKTQANNDANAINVGTRFTSDTHGWVTAVRFWKGAGNTGTHTGGLWSANGQLLAQATFLNETAGGWQMASLNPAVEVQANTQYVVSYNAPVGRYSSDSDFFRNKSFDASPLHAPATTEAAPNGMFAYGSFGFPTNTYQGGHYWVDAVFDTVAPPDTIAPTATPVSPLNGSSSVSPSTTASVQFNEAVQVATINMTMKNAANQAVTGSVAYDAANKIATFTPTAALAGNTTYTTSVTGAKDTAGNTMAGTTSWSFTTQKPANPGVCPCSVWDESATPQTVTVNDAGAVELGMRFRSDVSGNVTGVRFYKGPQNTGAHTGRLWSNTGTLLATVTFGTETTAGWQQALFSTAVHINANTTYVVSYQTSGYYSATSGGLNAQVANAPLRALANGTDGATGVYRYGTGGVFPTNGGGANYWVDTVFQPDPDLTPPTVTATYPGNDSRSVPRTTQISATFNEAINPATVQWTVTGGVTGTATYDSTTRTAKFQPTNQLNAATTYTVTVKASDTAGNAMPLTNSWFFTTSGVGACPCTLFNDSVVPASPSVSDTNAVELGMRITPDTNGWITGVRFYKGTGNTGTHTGSLWSTTGTRLATGTFSGETATGWQKLTFANPVQVSANTTYIVSYYAPNGRYAGDVNYFGADVDNAPLHSPANGSLKNGLFKYGAGGGFPVDSYQAGNYYVDAVFTNVAPPDTTAPTVVSTAPANGVTSVPTTTSVSVTFDEAIDPATPSVNLVPTGGVGASVAGSSTYDPATRTWTFTPASPLANATTYQATVSGAKDVAGNQMTGSVSWTFTTALPDSSGCPCTLFADSATPVINNANDNGQVELGVRFTVDQPGVVTGVRFYKGTGNSGTHVGHLWTSTGTLLGTVTFSNETVGGWQQANFATPITVAANTQYVVSYYAPNGHYSVTRGQFEFNGVDRGPMHAPKTLAGAPNGTYVYGNGGGFPTSGNDANYWVDAVYSPSSGTPSAASVRPVSFGRTVTHVAREAGGRMLAVW